MSRRREGIVPDVSGGSPVSSTTDSRARTCARTLAEMSVYVHTLFACDVRHYRAGRVCVVGSSHCAPAAAPCVRNKLDHGIVSRRRERPGLGSR